MSITTVDTRLWPYRLITVLPTTRPRDKNGGGDLIDFYVFIHDVIQSFTCALL